MGSKILDEEIIGKKFGKLQAIERVGKDKNGKYLWRCKCDCGNEIVVLQSSIRNGMTKSCGCLKREKRPRTTYSHRERLYVLWQGMKQRCNNENNISYKYYGEKGIKVCEEWENDYLTFKRWALDTGYDETLPRGTQTIDRIDVYGDYEPSNCRWINLKEQQNNKKNNKIFKIGNEKHTFAEWTEIYNIDYGVARARFYELGWDIEKALSEPVKKKK